MRKHHVALAVLCVTVGLSQVCPPRSLRADGPPAEEDAGERAPDYEAMIDALASRNAAPELIELRYANAASAHVMTWYDRQPLFAADYDWDEQSRVLKARKKLFDVEDPALWDHFIKHLDDDRYSATLGSGPNFSSNKTVADWCRDGLYARTNFASFVTKRERGGPGNSFSLGLDFSNVRWREEHPRAPLYELQIAVCERALEAIPLEKRLSADARARNSKRIQGYLDEIRKTKSPLFFRRNLDGYRLYDAETAKAIREKYELQALDKRRNATKKDSGKDDQTEKKSAKGKQTEEKRENEKERGNADGV